MSIRQGNKVIAGVSSIDAGFVAAFAGSAAPSGWLVCDGSAISRTDYADLFTAIGTTYGAGDGSTTFNLPDLSDCFVQGGTAGTTHTAGLPNITGDLPSLYAESSYTATGAFGKTATTRKVYKYTTNGIDSALDFDASRLSSIYGNSNTVQPKSVEMNWCIKY